MVYDWSPDPPDVDDRLCYPSQDIILDSDESEDEMPVNAPPGYEFVSLELLSQALGSSSDEESESETDTADGVVVSLSTNPVSDNPSASDPEAGRGNEVEEVEPFPSASSMRLDLTLDCDQAGRVIEDDEIDDEPRDTLRSDLTVDCDQAQRGSDVEGGHVASGTTLRPDISAHCEQMFAAMMGFTMPSSTLPPWMDPNPEIQLSALIARQMQWLEGNTSNT